MHFLSKIRETLNCKYSFLISLFYSNEFLAWPAINLEDIEKYVTLTTSQFLIVILN